MFTAHQAKEIVVKVRNDIGVLHQMVRVIAEKGVNILAANGYCEADSAVIRLVTEDNLRAMDALKLHNYHPVEKPVVQVEMLHKPGMLRVMTEKLAKEGIDINHLYASAGVRDTSSTLVIATSDNEKAIMALNR